MQTRLNQPLALAGWLRSRLSEDGWEPIAEPSRWATESGRVVVDHYYRQDLRYCLLRQFPSGMLMLRPLNAAQMRHSVRRMEQRAEQRRARRYQQLVDDGVITERGSR